MFLGHWCNVNRPFEACNKEKSGARIKTEIVYIQKPESCAVSKCELSLLSPRGTSGISLQSIRRVLHWIANQSNRVQMAQSRVLRAFGTHFTRLQLPEPRKKSVITGYMWQEGRNWHMTQKYHEIDTCCLMCCHGLLAGRKRRAWKPPKRNLRSTSAVPMRAGTLLKVDANRSFIWVWLFWILSVV